MAAPPTCRHCGAALPRSAMACPRCGKPVFTVPHHRRRKQRESALVGMAGSAIMAAQSASMVMGGVLAFIALNREFAGARSEALAWLGHASVFVGITLLFDFVGVSLLSGSFFLHSKAVRGEARTDPRLLGLARPALLASIFLLLWVLVTAAWRIALAAILQFYPTPLGADFDQVPVPDLQRAAAIMLGLWVVAAFLLFLGARWGSRFLRETKGRPVTFWRILWPLETLIHFVAAAGIALVAPALLANLAQLEITTLRTALALGVIDVALVPSLGVLAYTYMFGDFLDRFREARGPAAPSASAPAPVRPPEEA